MRERGDLDCAHEPFMYDYYVHRQVRRMPHFESDPEHPQDYASIRDMLLEKAEHKPVFFKDMSYYVIPHLLSDRAFCDALTHAFLIRDPMASILSYHNLDPNVTSDEIGLEAQWRHFKGLLDMGHMPVVIRSEEVRREPRATIGAFWHAVGLDYCESAFDWDKAPPKDWEQVSGWHDSVAGSLGIKPLTKADIRAQKQRFNEACRGTPRLAALLAHHQPYYDKLASHAIC